MKKTKKRILLCGIITVFAAVNMVVAVSNEKHKTLFKTENAEASVVNWYLIFYNIWESINQNNNDIVYRYNTRTGMSCTPVKIFCGKYDYNSSQAYSLNTSLGLEGSVTHAAGRVGGTANASYDATKNEKTNYQYEYNVEIILDGNDWTIKTCEPCSPTEPDVIGKNCTTYSECADAIKANASAYRYALGLNI